MSKLIVVGGGASGMMAAAIASARGIRTVLLEKNDKLGRKVYITGKGRCNLSNSCEPSDFFKNVVSNPKFLYSCVYGFSPADTIDYFENIGLKTKVERGNRVFPVSDHSSDVTKYLEKQLRANGCEVRLGCEVSELIIEEGICRGVVLNNGERLTADYVFIATGGLSYPSTGSTGDGYRFAKNAGHKVTRLLPSLVSIKTEEQYVKKMEGLSLKNVVLSASDGRRVLYSELGEMLFTSDGISGPLVLTLSAMLADTISSGNKIGLSVDLKPGLDDSQLDARILRDFNENINKNVSNVLGKLFPSTMIPVIIDLWGVAPERQVNSISKTERAALCALIRKFPLTVKRLGGYDEAVITKGGVDVKSVNPSTLESKIVSGLYFIGEVLDVDAFTGGYNLQIAWSTAHAAASSIE